MKRLSNATANAGPARTMRGRRRRNWLILLDAPCDSSRFLFAFAAAVTR
jgi:hypothetical protein